MLINKRLLTVYLLGSFLMPEMPAFGQANDVCADVSIEQVSQFLSAHQDEWEGQISSLEFMGGRFPPPPEEELAFSSLFEAAEAMQSSSNKESKMTLGTPFPAYTIFPENILNNTTCQSDFLSLLEFQGIWFAPVFWEDKPMYYWVEVSCHNGLSLAGSGYKGVAEELHTLNQKLVNHDVEQSWFVQVFSTQHIFLVVKYHGNDIIYPLRAFPSSYAGLETIDELGGYNPIGVLSKIKEQWPKPDCTVIYRQDGTLHIPCVTVEGSSEARYSAILEVIDQKALTFGVFELKDKSDYNGN
jgi:hypothetical protein